MNDLTAQPIAWAHHSTFNNLDNFDKSRFTATLSKKETNACCIPLFTNTQRTWVGLTDEERVQVINANTSTGLWHMAKDIEAKLKAKNAE